MPVTFLRGAPALRWTEVDRLLALALQAYEDGLCSSCGQVLKYAMDPDLTEEWSVYGDPHRCGGCTALAAAAEASKNHDHPGALRYVLGLPQGWEERKARLVAARSERATAGEHSHGPESGQH